MFHHWKFRPFGFGFRPFGSCFGGFWTYPKKSEYIKWLEEFKNELEEELKAVEREIEKLKEEE